MLVFSTRLPLKDDILPKECMRLFIEWIVDSPNYNIERIDYDVSSDKDFDCSFDNKTFSIRRYKDNKMEISACRFENKEQNVVWITDCIVLSEVNCKSLLIQLNCNRTNFDARLPHIHKPYIVRKFVDSGYCKDDEGIPITYRALESDDEYFDLCVKIMNGSLNYTMPTVYVSCDYWGNTVVDPQFLAKKLSGVAHVFVEKNSETALKLKEATSGNNAYTKYVGIYFPGTKFCQKYCLDYYLNDREMCQAIIDSVWKVLINASDSSKFNWNHIIALQARQKMKEFENISLQDKAQLEEYMDVFDQDYHDLSCQNEELNKENYALKTQLEMLKAALGNNSDDACFYKKGEEDDLYRGEQSDLLYSILSQVQSKYEPTSRAYTLIQSLLKANPKVGECERVLEGVSTIFSGDARLQKTSKSELKRLGFIIEEDGPHYKLFFHEPRYMFSVSKTPSDYREGRNLLSEIRSVIDIDRKI